MKLRERLTYVTIILTGIFEFIQVGSNKVVCIIMINFVIPETELFVFSFLTSGKRPNCGKEPPLRLLVHSE